jgi:hypothetical protein
VHLERASLKNAKLISAELSSVRAEQADLSGANCRGATLYKSDFRRAVCLEGTYLSHANLREADFTRAKMIGATLSRADLMIPVLPIIQSGHDVFSMFSDLQRRYFWIQPTVSYKNADQLVRYVDDAIIARAESAAAQIKKRRAVSVRAPVSVTRVNRKER